MLRLLFGPVSRVIDSNPTFVQSTNKTIRQLLKLAIEKETVELVGFFVNREGALRAMAEHMSHFILQVANPRTDTTRELRSTFSDGMFGRGKSELGAQAIIQFNLRGSNLLEGFTDAEALKNTWYC